jgi:mono/diheme cytochrome c family protein
VCHGARADGKGPVHEKFQGLIKSLLTTHAREFSDGRIYHVITAGQGVMGAYEAQIQNPEWRWAIVSYVRSLQAQSPADGSSSSDKQ